MNTMSVKDLCRLCAKNEDLSKDLLDSNNKNVLKLIQDLMQITISESDTLPTKVCLNCEERIVSFQLFILECYKVQDNFKKICAEDVSVKVEQGILDFGHSVIKSEVKDEFSAEDTVLCAINNDASMSEYEGGDFDNFDNHKLDSDDEDDDGDNVTLAELKKEKVEKKRKMPTEDITKFTQVLKKSHLKVKDFVKMHCDLCGFKGKSWVMLQEHYSEIHQGKLTLTCICGFSIKSKNILYKHVLDHKMEGENFVNKSEDVEDLQADRNYGELKAKHFVKLQCTICGEKAKTWAVLQDHYTMIHQSKLVVRCIVCGFSIKSKSVLYKHVLEHKIESEKLNHKEEKEMEKQTDSNYCNLKVKDFVDFSCQNCNKKFSSWYSLKSHTQSAHKTQPMVRCICGISLTSKTVLYKHVQDHKNPNSFCCDKCPRITKTLEALNKHKMMHVPKADRKFYCSSCDKIFNTKDSLKSHERSHIPIEERKIYHCGICNMKFTTRSSAASHKRVVHDKIKSYVCDLCGYACGTNGELRQHRAIHSDDKPFVCRKCYKSSTTSCDRQPISNISNTCPSVNDIMPWFKTHSNLSTHMDTHEETSYTCGVCSRVLNSRRTLRKHLLVHEERCKHVCDFCHKAFKRRQTLKVHLYTHTGDKPLTCKWCDERFAYASTLRSHRMRCHPDKMPIQSQHQQNATYRQYAHVPTEEYIKSDLAAIGLDKNPTESM